MPLRGSKATLFEGGVRSASFVWTATLSEEARGSTYEGLMHGKKTHIFCAILY
jgi:hypothetical protein